MRLGVVVGERDQRIGLGIVGADAPPRDVVGQDPEVADDPFDVVVHGGDQVHEIVGRETAALDVGGVHEDDHPRPVHPPEPVLVAVDGGVELAVAAQGDQLQHVRLAEAAGLSGEHLGGDDEVGLAGAGVPLALARAQRPRQAARIEHLLVETLEGGRPGLLDRRANRGVVRDPRVPGDGRIGSQCRLGDPGDDRGLGEQVRARRLHLAVRAVEMGEAALHRDRLRTRGLLVDLDPTQTGEQIGDLAVHDVAAVQLGGDRDRQAKLAPSLLDAWQVGCGPGEIAAESDEGLHFAGDHLLAGLDRGQALMARGVETVELLQLVQRR